ncbi:MAG: 2-dehydro-3-deoxyglucarate aldolase [Candidimonas sp.]|nr:MAG: 2-dehydro-3-deoxyglucarate aldolase [Candidimonas sp.]
MIQANKLKQNLARNHRQIGLWCSLASNVTAEAVAGSGFDWLLIDGEHAPNDLRSIMAQLQAVAPYPLEPVVRLPSADPFLIQQYLDVGARAIMIPDVRTAAGAAAIIAATRYPPRGVRSVSTSIRANRYGHVPNYHANADQDICMILQIESPEGAANAEAIAAVDGVDALFIGPADLSTNMGHFIQPGHDDVQKAMIAIRDAARRRNKAVGILAGAIADAERYLKLGMALVAVGSDQGLLTKASDQLAQHFRQLPE